MNNQDIAAIEKHLDHNLKNNPNYNPSFMIMNPQNFLEMSINRIGGDSRNLQIKFDDDIWNFQSFLQKSLIGNNIVDFSFFSEEDRFFCKMYFLFKIYNFNKPMSVFKHIKHFYMQLNSILGISRINEIKYLDSNKINNRLSKSNLSTYEKAFLIMYFISFVNFLKDVFNMSFEIDLNNLFSNQKKYRAIYKKETIKYPLVPWHYWEAIRNSFTACMRDKNEIINNRLVAALTLIILETGLRVGDALLLKDDSFYYGDGLEKRVGYITYYNEKTYRFNKNRVAKRTRASNLCLEACEFLYSNRPNISNPEHYLFVLEHNYCRKKPIIGNPVTYNRFHNWYKALILHLLPEEASHSWEGINESQISTSDRRRGYFPYLHSFRVNMYTRLIDRQIPPSVVKKWFDHVNSAVSEGYYRAKDRTLENNIATLKTLQAVIEEKTIPLGGKGDGIEMANNILSYLEANTIKPISSASEIVEKFKGKIIASSKPFGFCIKMNTSTPCGSGEAVDKVLCAYDLCPNIYFFYFNIDSIYEDYCSSIESYKLNMNNGHLMEAEKEKKRIVAIVRKRLIPILDELEKEIGKIGLEKINALHPEITNLVTRRDEIRKEINEWTIEH